MSVATIQSSIQRVQRELEQLHRQATDESQRQAAKAGRISQIRGSITRHTSQSLAQSKEREIAGLERDIISSQKRQADISKRLSDKTAELHRYQRDLYKEQEREHKSLISRLAQRDRELRVEQEDALGRLLTARSHAAAQRSPEVAYDAFISHATEDKEELVRPLAEKLRDAGLAIWYDEFNLKVGDSLRRSIDAGLVNSRFGIVVFSPSFFAKGWPQYELDGLVTREVDGEKVILPLWHKVSKDQVAQYSPSLADKFALNTATYSIDELVRELAAVLRPPLRPN